MSRRFLALILTFLSTTALAEGPSAMTTTDKRIVIPVTAAERNQVLFEMREFLQGLHNIHHALARRDMKAVATEARPLGRMLDRIPPGMKERLPEEFTQLGITQHEAFEVLARDAENKGDLSMALEQLAEIYTYCSGCHDTYRFQISPALSRK